MIDAEPTPEVIWQEFHWSFFTNIQALIICLHRFESRFASGRFDEARAELQTATDLLIASGAAMQLAGSYTREAYERQVRASMTQPHVRSSKFSGLMSWDHAALMRVWRRLCPVFEDLPAPLKAQHESFVEAYFTMAQSHQAVCEKFGGVEGGSLRFEDCRAVELIKKFGRDRWKLIDPHQSVKKGCPFHPR